MNEMNELAEFLRLGAGCLNGRVYPEQSMHLAVCMTRCPAFLTRCYPHAYYIRPTCVLHAYYMRPMSSPCPLLSCLKTAIVL